MNTGAAQNPFSSHLLEPARGGYIFNDARDSAKLADIIAGLQAHHFRGHLVGPHGAGKSTLLTDIHNHLRNAGHTISRWQVNDRCRAIPSSWLNDIRLSDILLIDGTERLYPGLFALVRIATRLLRRGLIVTTHSSSRFGFSIPVEPDPIALAVKIAALTNGSNTSNQEIETAQALVDRVREHLRRHNGNAREVLIDLYLEHESKSRV